MEGLEVPIIIAALVLMFAALGAMLFTAQLITRMKSQIDQVFHAQQEALRRLKKAQSQQAMAEKNENISNPKKQKVAKKQPPITPASANPEASRTCGYVREDGSRCPGTVEGDGDLCFWHDPDASKEDADVKERLQQVAKSGESMEGFVLRFAHLEGVRLFDDRGFNLNKAVLFRARLQGASMFNINLKGADLKKADLSGANLNEAKVQDADFLGTVLDGTKLERTEWGEKAIQEQMAIAAEKAGDAEEARLNYTEAEEVYRNLRQAYDSAGRSQETGHFFQKEMTMRRKLMPKFSSERIWMKLVDIFCGYGEQSQRVIGFSLLVIFGCGILYFGVGVNGPEGRIGFDPEAGWLGNVGHFFNCIYYSVVTFTTLGYGDVTPRGIARPFAAFEAFVGAFMMALFIVVFGKKMTRG